MRHAGLSTGEAAVLCSVNPDTVLKWIKKGRVAATRTAGGHYRIAERDLASLLPEHRRTEAEEAETPAGGPQALRCWEYLSKTGSVREECRKCVVYQIRAAWCFRLATSLGCELGQKQTFCSTSCADCAYYRRATGLATNVLVITADDELVRDLGEGDHALQFRFARNAYQASAAIATFHAAFVVVDQEVIADGQADLLACLTADPRLPGVRIILGISKSARTQLALGEGVVTTIERPWTRSQIAEVVDRFPVELVPAVSKSQP